MAKNRSINKIILVATSNLAGDQRLQRISSALLYFGIPVNLIGANGIISQPNFEFIITKNKKGKFFYLEFNFKLFVKLLSVPKSTLIVANDLDTILAVWMASVFKKFKFVFDAHEYFEQTPEVERRPITRTIWHLIGHLTIPFASACYTVSAGLQSIFTKKYKRNFGLVRNVPLKSDTEIKPPKTIDPNNIRLLYVGAVNEGRGIDLLLGVVVKNIHLNLTVCGTGDVLNQSILLCQQLNIANRVKFVGFVKPTDLLPYYANADIGCLVLEPRGLSYTYSLANKFFDYIQQGLPQICPNLPEYNTILTDYPVGVACDYTEQSVGRAIDAVIKQYNDFKSAIDKASEIFTWENEQIILIGIYKKLIEIAEEAKL